MIYTACIDKFIFYEESMKALIAISILCLILVVVFLFIFKSLSIADDQIEKLMKEKRKR